MSSHIRWPWGPAGREGSWRLSTSVSCRTPTHHPPIHVHRVECDTTIQYHPTLDQQHPTMAVQPWFLCENWLKWNPLVQLDVCLDVECRRPSAQTGKLCLVWPLLSQPQSPLQLPNAGSSYPPSHFPFSDFVISASSRLSAARFLIGFPVANTSSSPLSAISLCNESVTPVRGRPSLSARPNLQTSQRQGDGKCHFSSLFNLVLAVTARRTASQGRMPGGRFAALLLVIFSAVSPFFHIVGSQHRLDTTRGGLQMLILTVVAPLLPRLWD